MTRVLYVLAFAWILMAGFCEYRAVPLGMAAAEGLRSSPSSESLLGMKAQAEQWNRRGEIAFGVSVVACFLGWKLQGKD